LSRRNVVILTIVTALDGTFEYFQGHGAAGYGRQDKRGANAVLLEPGLEQRLERDLEE
jgi:hypothetical protein